MADYIVKVDHVSHRYAVQWAVNDVSFEIPKTGIYGLLGSNGAGKSTLMNILCGVIRQTKGDVYINGINIKQNPKKVKEYIGFMPQYPPVYEDFTVEEYLTYAANLRHVPDKEVKNAVEEVLDLCNITHFRHRLIKSLSGGYQQRVAIAQAIVHKPALVVLDEPTNGLDPNQILDIRELIKNIAQKSTVILSTHILREVHAICDHIIMIEQGKLVFSGSIEQFDAYVTPVALLVSLQNTLTLEELQRISGVKKVEEAGMNQFRIYFNDKREVINNLVRENIRQDWNMTELRLEKCSLEYIFAELSKGVKR